MATAAEPRPAELPLPGGREGAAVRLHPLLCGRSVAPPAYLLRQPGRLAALRGMLASDHAEDEARIDRVEAPALVVMGTRDPDFPDPRAEAELVAARLGGEVVLVDGAGHYPQAERPERTAEAIIAFLAEHATGHGARV
jgi:pimeloyl-ACP methyl ester carboxylesterase